MRRAIRPGMTSGGTTKLIHDTTTNKPEKKVENLSKNVTYSKHQNRGLPKAYF